MLIKKNIRSITYTIPPKIFWNISDDLIQSYIAPFIDLMLTKRTIACTVAWWQRDLNIQLRKLHQTTFVLLVSLSFCFYACVVFMLIFFNKLSKKLLFSKRMHNNEYIKNIYRHVRNHQIFNCKCTKPWR